MSKEKKPQEHHEVKRCVIIDRKPQDIVYHKVQFGELPDTFSPAILNGTESFDEESLYSLGVKFNNIDPIIQDIQLAWGQNYDAGMQVKRGKKGPQVVARIIGYSTPYISISGEPSVLTIFVELDNDNLPTEPDNGDLV